MSRKTEILNIYRHAKGLFESAERVARSEGVIRCPVCREVHATWEGHPVSCLKPEASLIVEHKPKKTNKE